MAENGLIDISSFITEIHKIYTFGYPDCNEEFISEFSKWIVNRICFLVKEAKYISVEDTYVETEWKDMVALHYINTSYASSILPHVIRVHFFSTNAVYESTYMGFITIRPIEELSIALSYVFLNWTFVARAFGAESARFVHYKKRIHCLTKELFIETYPILVQDSIVTCCADVNIITLSRFLSHKYGGRKKAEIRDICKDDYNFAIPRVIKTSYFEELCIKHHVPYKVLEINRTELVSERELEPEDRNKRGVVTVKTKEGIGRYIDSYLDSNLPVIIHSNNHVVQIVGWFVDENGIKKHVVFDDSGYLYPEKKSSSETIGPVLYAVDLSEEFLRYYCPPKCSLQEKYLRKLINIGIPQYDRVYIDYPQYEYLLDMYINGIWGKKENSILPKEVTSNVYNPYSQFSDNECGSVIRKSRLVECSKLVMFFRHNLDIAIDYQKINNSDDVDDLISILKEVLDILEKISLPHYIWYTELYGREGNIAVICADPTRLYNSSLVDNVFYNSQLKRNNKLIVIAQSMWDDTKVKWTAEMEEFENRFRLAMAPLREDTVRRALEMFRRNSYNYPFNRNNLADSFGVKVSYASDLISRMVKVGLVKKAGKGVYYFTK